MSRWFRHYAGMMRDEKLVRVAVKSKQPVERVVWVWGALLESAAEINDGGRYEFDPGEAAYFLRCDEPDLAGILACLEDSGRIGGGVVVRWGDRQYSSDAAAERQRRYRQRKAGSDVSDHNGDRDSDAESDVTRPSRDGAVTAQETETELETDSEKTPAPVLVAEDGARDLFDEVWKAFPQNPTSIKAEARPLFDRLKSADQVRVMEAAKRYRQWFTEDNAGRKRSEDEGLRFVPRLSTWLENGAWRHAGELPLKSDPAAPAAPMVRLSRSTDESLWLACERIMNKRAATSNDGWAFPAEIVAQARKELSH